MMERRSTPAVAHLSDALALGHSDGGRYKEEKVSIAHVRPIASPVKHDPKSRISIHARSPIHEQELVRTSSHASPTPVRKGRGDGTAYSG